jgi:hypothetical protein
MTQAARPAVDHHADLTGTQTERRGHGRVVDVLHDLDLEEVIAGSEAAHLPEPTLHGTLTDVRGIRTTDRTAVLAAFEVPLDAESLLDRVAGADQISFSSSSEAPDFRRRAPRILSSARP